MTFKDSQLKIITVDLKKNFKNLPVTPQPKVGLSITGSSTHRLICVSYRLYPMHVFMHHLSIHSWSHLPNNPFTHASMSPFVHLSIHTPTWHPPTNLFIMHPSVHSPTLYLTTNLFMHAFMYVFIHVSTHQPILACMHPCHHASINPCVYLTTTYRSMHASTQGPMPPQIYAYTHPCILSFIKILANVNLLS